MVLYLTITATNAELCQIFNTLIADAEDRYDLNRWDDQLVS